MSLPLGRWTNFLALLGRIRGNRRQRQAAASRRRNVYRRHGLVEGLEERVYMDAAPIAADISNSLRVRSDEPLMVDMSAYVSQMGGYDPDGGDPVQIIAGNNPPAYIALMGDQDYTWNYTIQDDEGMTDEGSIHLTGIANTNPVAQDDYGYSVEIPFGQSTVEINLADYPPVLGNDGDADGDSFDVLSPPSGTVSVGIEGYSYEYTIVDEYGGQSSAWVHIGATQQQNDPPVAVDDTEYAVEIPYGQSTITVDLADYPPVLTNDYDPEGDHFDLVGSAPGGPVTFGLEGYSYQYSIVDQWGRTSSATVTITATQGEPTNTPPTANDDIYPTIEIDRDAASAQIDFTNIVPVKENDVEPDAGDSIDVTSYEGPTGLQWYGPGEYAWKYTITDTHGATAEAYVRVQIVNRENQAPTAVDDDLPTITVPYVSEGADVNWDEIREGLKGNDSDPEGDMLSVIGGPSGVEWIAAGTSVQHEYTISDGHGGTSSAYVRVSVERAANGAPTAENDEETITISHHESAAWIDWTWLLENLVRQNDSDPDGHALEITAFNGPPSEEVPHGESRTYNYTVSDGHGGSASATITVHIHRPNENPVANDDAHTIEIGHNDENAWIDWTTYLPSIVLGNDTDADGDQPMISGFSGPSYEQIGWGQSRTYTYTIDDGHGGTATANVTVNVTRPNENPTASGYQHTITIGRDASGTTVNWDDVRAAILSGASDADGDQLAIEGVSGTEWIGAGQTASRTFVVNDGHGGTVSVDATVSVENEANQQPTAADDYYNLDSFGTLTTFAPGVLVNDGDPEGDQLTVTGFTPPAHGSVTVNGDGSFTYTPDLTFETDDQFTYTVSDGHGGTATATVYIHYDRPPIAADDAFDVWGDQINQIPADGVLANDTGAYDGTKQFVEFPANRTAHGYVTLSADGSFSYTPDAGFYGQDSFEYRLAGGGGTKDSGIVTLHVHRPPAAVNDVYVVMHDGVDAQTSDSLTDNDTGEWEHIRIVQGPTNGTLDVIDYASGYFKYTTNAGYYGSDYFTYVLVAADGRESDEAGVSLERMQVNIEYVDSETYDFVLLEMEFDYGVEALLAVRSEAKITVAAPQYAKNVDQYLYSDFRISLTTEPGLEFYESATGSDKLADYEITSFAGEHRVFVEAQDAGIRNWRAELNYCGEDPIQDGMVAQFQQTDEAYRPLFPMKDPIMDKINSLGGTQPYIDTITPQTTGLFDDLRVDVTDALNLGKINANQATTLQDFLNARSLFFSQQIVNKATAFTNNKFEFVTGKNSPELQALLDRFNALGPATADKPGITFTANANPNFTPFTALIDAGDVTGFKKLVEDSPGEFLGGITLKTDLVTSDGKKIHFTFDISDLNSFTDLSKNKYNLTVDFTDVLGTTIDKPRLIFDVEYVNGDATGFFRIVK